jgi:hypothetical protein
MATGGAMTYRFIQQYITNHRQGDIYTSMDASSASPYHQKETSYQIFANRG